jgi:hypothetical protein
LDPCLPVDPPLYCGRLPAPCPVNRVASNRWIKSACVLVPDLREVVLCIIVASRRTPFGCAAAAEWRLRRCLVALARYVPAAIKATSLPLLVSDAAHDKGSWPFRLPRPDPKLSELRTTGTGVASTSPQLRGRIRDSLRRSSMRMSYAAQQRQSARPLPLSFHASGSAGRWPTLGVTEDVLPG